jgi:hypothetical protein
MIEGMPVVEVPVEWVHRTNPLHKLDTTYYPVMDSLLARLKLLEDTATCHHLYDVLVWLFHPPQIVGMLTIIPQFAL